jgi:hypothetical protein
MLDAHVSEFERGILLYTEGRYWDAHEAWEVVWRADRQASWSDFVQALILMTAAFHKLYVQRRPSNAANMLSRAMARLEKYPSPFVGIDTDALRNALREAHARIVAIDDATEMAPDLAPPLRRSA